jgi:hypothetical protein
MAVFGAVLVVQFTYHLLDYPGAGPFPVVMVAVFTIAAAGMRRPAILGATFVALWAALMQVLGEGASPLSPTVIMPAVFVAASVFAGEAAHNRSRYLAEVRERIARTEADRELEAQRRLTEERPRIARELHDIMAHTITVITVQAGGGPGRRSPELPAFRSFWNPESHPPLTPTIGCSVPTFNGSCADSCAIASIGVSLVALALSRGVSGGYLFAAAHTPYEVPMLTKVLSDGFAA